MLSLFLCICPVYPPRPCLSGITASLGFAHHPCWVAMSINQGTLHPVVHQPSHDAMCCSIGRGSLTLPHTAQPAHPLIVASFMTHSLEPMSRTWLCLSIACLSRYGNVNQDIASLESKRSAEVAQPL